jgi:hypothetical protein
VTFEHHNPVNGSRVTSHGHSSYRTMSRQESDPRGAETPLSNPFVGGAQDYVDWKFSQPLFIEGGDPFDYTSGREIDGLPVSEAEFQRRLASGSVQTEYPGRYARPGRPEPIKKSIINHGLGIYEIYVPSDLRGSERPGNYVMYVTQAPQFLTISLEETKKRIRENRECAELFGGEKKALSELDKLQFEFGTLDNDGIAEIKGKKVTLDNNRFSSAGSIVGFATNIRESTVEGRQSTSFTLKTLAITGSTFGAFVLLHELGHKTKIYGKYEKDGSPQYINLPAAANNEKIRAACFGELEPVLVRRP